MAAIAAFAAANSGIISLIGAGISAIAQIRAAQAQQVQYEIQARNAEIQGRVDAANYRMEGANILNNMERAMAASTARTAAGGLNPYASGESADLINTYSMKVGIGDSNLAKDNAMLALDAGARNAASNRAAGRAAVAYGTAAAIGNFASSVGQTFSQGNPFSPSGSSGNATG